MIMENSGKYDGSYETQSLTLPPKPERFGWATDIINTGNSLKNNVLQKW